LNASDATAISFPDWMQSLDELDSGRTRKNRRALNQISDSNY
jgi:hypothetical protein